MMEDTIIEEGQVFQPYSDNPNELIKYTSGRWLRSLDSGKTYSYRLDMQEKNKSDAFTASSQLIKKTEQKFNRLSSKDSKAYELYREDQKRPISKRNTFNVKGPIGMIVMNEDSLDEDIDNAIETGSENTLLATMRLLLHNYLIENSEFNVAAYIKDKIAHLTVVGENKANLAPHLNGLFRHSRVSSLIKRFTELLAEFEAANQTKNTTNDSTDHITDQTVNKGLDHQIIKQNIAKPYVFILGPMQTRLYKTLSPYVQEDQLNKLEILLEKGQIEDRIWVKLRADSFGYIFRQARGVENGAIIEDMRTISKWLATYFSYGKTNPKVVSSDYAYKVLRGNVDIKKVNQIRLK